MNILAAREHSVAELRNKLRTKLFTRLQNKLKHQVSQKSHEDTDFEDQQMLLLEQQKEHADVIIEDLLEQLIEENLLNDERFAETFIRSRMARGQGPVKIRHELQERQVALEFIDEYLDENYDFWHEILENVRRKRFGEGFPQDYKEQSRQSRFLYQRGFGTELIRRLFNQL